MLFRSDRVASVVRPALELKGVVKVVLGAGATETARLRVPVRELGFPGADLQRVLEPGEIEILAGPCADRAQLLSSLVTVVGRSH